MLDCFVSMFERLLLTVIYFFGRFVHCINDVPKFSISGNWYVWCDSVANRSRNISNEGWNHKPPEVNFAQRRPRTQSCSDTSIIQATVRNSHKISQRDLEGTTSHVSRGLIKGVAQATLTNELQSRAVDPVEYIKIDHG